MAPTYRVRLRGNIPELSEWLCQKRMWVGFLFPFPIFQILCKMVVTFIAELFMFLKVSF